MNYLVSERTAGQLRALLGQGGSVGGRTPSAPQSRGTTWVKVTGEPDDDGWHPAVVSLPKGDDWEDLTVEVLVAAVDGSDLVEDDRYLCSRTGDSPTHQARFYTAAPSGSTGCVPYLVSRAGNQAGTTVYNFTSSNTPTAGAYATGWKFSIAEPGLWLVTFDAVALVGVLFGPADNSSVKMRLNILRKGSGGSYSSSPTSIGSGHGMVSYSTAGLPWRGGGTGENNVTSFPSSTTRVWDVSGPSEYQVYADFSMPPPSNVALNIAAESMVTGVWLGPCFASIVHTVEEITSDGGPIWRYLGLPVCDGTGALLLVLFSGLQIVLAVSGYADGSRSALWALLVIRLADCLVSHWLPSLNGRRPNPGLLTTTLYTLDAAVAALVLSGGLY